MSSIIHYKFKAAKSWDPLLFEGTALSVAEAKRQITATKKLHKQAADSDIVLSNEQTGEDYEDSAHIPKNSRILVRRVPATKARTIKFEQAPDATDLSTITNDASNASIAAHQSMQNQPMIMHHSNMPPNVQPALAGATLGVNRCQRCGSSDHHVQFCPLQQSVYNNSQQVPQNQAQPNIQSQLNVNPPAATVSHDTEADRLAAEFRCAICSNFYSNAQVVPCCFASFCDECIRQTLLSDNSLTCPACQSKPVDIEQLQPNTQLQKAVDDYLARQQMPPQPRAPPPSRMQPPPIQSMPQRQQAMQNPPMNHGNAPPFGQNHPDARFAGPQQPFNQQQSNNGRPPQFGRPMSGQVTGPMMAPNRMPPQQFPQQHMRPVMQQPMHQHPMQQQQHQQQPMQMQAMHMQSQQQQQQQQQQPQIQQQQSGHIQHPSRQFVSHYTNQGPPNSGFTSQYLNGHPSNDQERHDRLSPSHQDRSDGQERNGHVDQPEQRNQLEQHRDENDHQNKNRDQLERRDGDKEFESRSQQRPPQPDEPQKLHTVVSYHMLPCSWNGAARSLALVVLDNDVRAIAGTSLLPNSSFKLGQQYLGLRPNEHLLLARHVPPTNSNSHVLINRAGLEQWLEWHAQGRDAPLPMPDDFRAVAIDCVLPWMRHQIEFVLVPSQAPNVTDSSAASNMSIDSQRPPTVISGNRKVVVRARSGATRTTEHSEPVEGRRDRDTFEGTSSSGSHQGNNKRSVKRRRSKSPDISDKRSYSDRPRDSRHTSPERRDRKWSRKERSKSSRDSKHEKEHSNGEEKKGGRHNVKLRER